MLKEDLQYAKNFGAEFEQKLRDVGIATSHDLSDLTCQVSNTRRPTPNEYRSNKQNRDSKGKELGKLMTLKEKNISTLKIIMANFKKSQDEEIAQYLYNTIIASYKETFELRKEIFPLMEGMAKYEIALIDQLSTFDQEINEINKKIDNLAAVTEISNEHINRLETRQNQLQDKIKREDGLCQSYPQEDK